MFCTPSDNSVKHAFLAGDVIAYPTEAVFGLGCDPTNESAIEKVLALKNRPASKGLILVASQWPQLSPYVDFGGIPKNMLPTILNSWPGPNTWLLPKSKRVSSLLSGDSESIAVRVSAFSTVKELCQTLESAIVSTSANLTGQSPARTAEQVRCQFGDNLLCINMPVGNSENPSQIRNGLTGEIIRAN